jgi:hypothetical protein
MKFKLTFKTPYVTDAIDDMADADLNDGEEREALVESGKELARKFVEYDEYIVIEFDTEKQTATVLPVR